METLHDLEQKLRGFQASEPFVTSAVLRQSVLKDIADLRAKLAELGQVSAPLAEKGVKVIDNAAYHMIIIHYGQIEYIREKFNLGKIVDAAGRLIEVKTDE